MSLEDRPAHGWYRFVLSFPPHLVRDCLNRLGDLDKGCVLDPFCGTGTTVVECKKRGIASIGVESNLMAHFASQVKVDWAPDAGGLVRHATKVASIAQDRLAAAGIEDDDTPPLLRRRKRVGRPRTETLRSLPPESLKLLLKDSISPLPLHKTLVLLECLEQNRSRRYHGHELLALAKVLVSTIGNLHFGPEVGVGPPKEDAPVVPSWLAGIERMSRDLRELKALDGTPATVFQADSRDVPGKIEADTVDAVITSPPYPNEKDYTRTTRLESVILGFIKDRSDLRAIKQGLVRSNSRGVYKGDDDDQWILDHRGVQGIARTIEARRVELGKTSGFERMYPRVAKLYFGGMARHLAELRQVLRRGAMLFYVVGDQASFLRVMIRTGKLLGEIAESLGYEVVGRELFRTRLATATRESLREEVLVLRWPG